MTSATLRQTPARPARGYRFLPSLAVAALLATGALASGCRGTDDPVVIGLAGPFSEPRGRSMMLAAQLAVQEINRSGVLGGRQLELRLMDDSASSARAIIVADSLRSDDAVVAVVGHLTSAPTIAAAAVYNGGRRPVVEISPSASSPDLTGIGPYTFRVCATDLAHGTALAAYAWERLGVRRVAVIYQNDDYGRGILATFRAEMLRRGGTVEEQDPVLGAATDPAPYIDHIRAGLAQAVMVAGDRQTAVGVLRMLRQRGLTLPVLGGDALTGIQSEGALADGVYLTSNYLPERPGAVNAAFVRAYGAANAAERPDHRGAGAYDAMYLLADAIRVSGTSRRAIRDYLASIGNDRPGYEGVTGRIEFDATGDVRNKSVVVGVVRGGRITLADAP